MDIATDISLRPVAIPVNPNTLSVADGGGTGVGAGLDLGPGGQWIVAGMTAGAGAAPEQIRPRGYRLSGPRR